MSGSDSALVRWYEDNEVIRPAYWLRYPKLAEESESSTMLICVHTCSPAIKARLTKTHPEQCMSGRCGSLVIHACVHGCVYIRAYITI